VFLWLSMTAEEIFESVTNGGRSDFAEVVSILAKADPGWVFDRRPGRELLRVSRLYARRGFRGR